MLVEMAFRWVRRFIVIFIFRDDYASLRLTPLHSSSLSGRKFLALHWSLFPQRVEILQILGVGSVFQASRDTKHCLCKLEGLPFRKDPSFRRNWSVFSRAATMYLTCEKHKFDHLMTYLSVFQS